MIPESLLHQPTAFVGRKEELRQILEMLADPDCRLLTLVGPGGIGKTRLALQAARQLQDTLTHGAFFVPLQSVQSAELLIPTLAETIHLQLSGQAAPHAQLFNHLQNREMLLLLDNFEHLLDAAGLLSGLMRAAPQVQLLVTSREALNLQEEWLYPVEGLSVPPGAQSGELTSYEAVELFVARARHVRPDFCLADEREGVVRICQLVEGMPLALELAASWLTTLRCADIAAEIDHSIDFLSTRLRNVPARHRSMRAVFGQSWKMLSEAEQSTFQRLSVFRGGFRRSAATTVAGASLFILSGLVDKSLIGRDDNGRYYIHELLRQYGAEKLAESPAAVEEVRGQHCKYYARYMHERLHAMNSHGQIRASAQIAAELANVRAAWDWAVARADTERLFQMGSTFFFFCQLQSRFLEGANALEAAAVKLDGLPASRERDRTLARLLNHQGWLRIRVGEFDKAEAVLSRSRELLTQLGEPPPPHMGGDSAVPLGIVHLIRGDSTGAESLAREARRAAAARNDQQNLSFAHYLLTAVKSAQGEYEIAYDHAQQACNMAQAAGNRWFLAYPLNEWGNVARAMGDYEEAKRHFQASYAVRKEFDDPEGMAVALNHLGEIAFLQSDYQQAAQLYRQGLSAYQDINDLGGRARSLQGLGRVASARQEYQTARERLAQALDMAYEIRFWPLIFSLLLDAGELFSQTDESTLGIELAAWVQHHPRSDHERTARARQQLARWQEGVDPLSFAEAVERGKEWELAAVVSRLRAMLTEPLLTSPSAQAPEQPLVEPLTDRELEVLRLIAQGYTNPEIADALVIALGTVKWYASQIFGKMGVSNRTEAAVRGRELGLLS
jgi:predicted ATPase/DNA-binding CsgD family transcriptional regulator